MKFCSIYVTAGNEEEAAKIGRALVEEKLAACANILPARSIYRWEEKTEDESEAVMFLKTREELAEKAIARVKELHSYDVPCIVCFPIAKGNADYLRWIEDSTG